MKKINLILVIYLFFCSCKEIKKPDNVTNDVAAISISKPIYCDTIKNSIGVIYINNENFKKGEQITILNEDRSKFKDWGATEEYQILTFKCYSSKDNLYSILFDDEIKFIKKEDDKIEFLSWEEHILKNVFSVGFDFSENPIRESINGKSLISKKSNNYRISVVQIEKEWMKVKYQNYNDESTTEGWIKWRDEECLFIELFYFA